MIRNDDRLYHIVVSFPSICAKQFLIFKFKRNEAICCLIGFGIGIGCCLMFRWLKNTFFKMNLITTTSSSSVVVDSISSTSHRRHLCLAAAAFEDTGGGNERTPFHRRYCCNHPNLFSSGSQSSDTDNNNNNNMIGRDRQQNRSNNDTNNAGVFNNTINNFNTFNSTSQKKRCGKSTTTVVRMRKGDRLSRSSSQIKELLTNKNESTSNRSPNNNKYNSFDSYLQLKYMDQPMNDIYHNLAKFLTRNFCKSMKMRRSMSGCKRATAAAADTEARETRNRLNQLFKQMRPVSSPPSQSAQQQPQGSPRQHDYHMTTSMTSSSSGINGSTPTNASYFPPVRSRTVSNSAAVLSSDTMIASSSNATVTSSSNERISRSNTNLDDLGAARRVLVVGDGCRDNIGSAFFNNQSTTSIDQIFFPAGSSSCLGSTFDIDFSIDSKAHDSISIRSGATSTTGTTQHQVDKSLDEALQHIDKLKEDMNHLCKDLDTLYSRRIIYDHAFYLPSMHSMGGGSSNSNNVDAFKSSSTNSVNLWEGCSDDQRRRISSSTNNNDSFTHYRSNTSLASSSAAAAVAVAAAAAVTAAAATSGVGSRKCTQTQTSPKRISKLRQKRRRLGRCWCRHGCGQVYRRGPLIIKRKFRVNESKNNNNNDQMPSLDEI